MTTGKWQVLVRGQAGSHRAFADRIKGELAPKLQALGPAQLKVTVTEEPPPKSLFGFKRSPLALLSIWADAPDRFTSAIEEIGLPFAAYEVEESAPVMYERTWADGEPTPSPILLTLLKKKPGLSDDEYMRRWHGGHTPLSLKIHPLWFYLRNVVVQPLKDNGGSWDGIVEEACVTKDVLLSPSQFFGGRLMMVPNMIRVWADIHGFLDVKNIEVFYATEYHLKSS